MRLLFKPRFAVLLCLGLFPSLTHAEVDLPKSIDVFMKKHCYRCHGTETQEAELALHDMERVVKDSADALNWQDILDKLNAGEMPPEDEPQPSREELARVVGDLTQSLQAARKMLRDTSGEIVLRRLNRREYESTIKALMGIRIKAEALPEDPSGRFDTIGQNQSLTSIDLENYLNQGQEIARTAMHWAVLPRAKPRVVRRDAANLGKAEKKIYEILEKVQEVHETDRPYTEVGLTEYEWNRYNRGSEKYPRHAEYRDRRNLAGYYRDNLEYHALGRMLPIRNLVNSVGLPVQRDARAYYRLRTSAGVVDGVNIRRSIRMTVSYGKRGLGGENGKPIGSFYVTGSIEDPSTHEMVWYPEFEADFRPSTPGDARKNVTFLEDQRGGPATGQLYQHYWPIEPDAPEEAILLKWMEVEGPFYDEKTPFEESVDDSDVGTHFDSGRGVAWVTLDHVTNGAFDGIQAAINAMETSASAATVFVDLPIDEPGCALLAENLMNHGLRLAGIGPRFRKVDDDRRAEDVLRLQLNVAPVDIAGLVVEGDLGRALADQVVGS
ncbi:MAG: DUF1587 domain-containing protein [Planctomycetota bacterium]|nr:DUF1587 domain-containing protein [Planctomycetota bacterium]